MCPTPPHLLLQKAPEPVHDRGGGFPYLGPVVSQTVLEAVLKKDQDGVLILPELRAHIGPLQQHVEHFDDAGGGTGGEE